jgi:hypothetical protein
MKRKGDKETLKSKNNKSKIINTKFYLRSILLISILDSLKYEIISKFILK